MLTYPHVPIFSKIGPRKPDDSNVRQCLPVNYSTTEYDKRDLEFIIALSVTLGLTAIELLGFLSGISMFMPFQSLLSIGAHFAACIGLAYFIFWNWPCYFYWYFFGICSAAPTVTEIITIIAAGAHASGAVILFFFLFHFWPCTYYWYIFGFCSALPFVTEIVVAIGVFCFRKGI